MTYERDPGFEEDEFVGAGVIGEQERELEEPAIAPLPPPVTIVPAATAIPSASPEPKKSTSWSRMFETPKSTDKDMRTDDLVSISEEDVMGGDPDMSDLTDVPDSLISVDPSVTSLSRDDITGSSGAARPRRPARLPQYRRTQRRYPPQTGIIGSLG